MTRDAMNMTKNENNTIRAMWASSGWPAGCVVGVFGSMPYFCASSIPNATFSRAEFRV
jgi:hypothetical protein